MGFFDSKRSKSALAKDRKYFNSSEKHEVAYAKTFKRKKKTYSKFDGGGGVDSDIQWTARVQNPETGKIVFFTDNLFASTEEEALDKAGSVTDWKNPEWKGFVLHDVKPSNPSELMKKGGGVDSKYIKHREMRFTSDKHKNAVVNYLFNHDGDETLLYYGVNESLLEDRSKNKEKIKSILNKGLSDSDVNMIYEDYIAKSSEFKYKSGGLFGKKTKISKNKKHITMAKNAKGKKLLKAHKPTQKDKDTKAKPTGYRWKTTQLKKKKDGTESAMAKKLHFKRPTKDEIEKYKKHSDGTYDNETKQIYHERRADRTHSDDNLKKKYEGGGDVAVEVSISELKEMLGREPKYPSDFVNGKKYVKCFLRPYYKMVD
jgi:hypothetical protein